MDESNDKEKEQGPEIEGTVIESMPNDMYRIQTDSGTRVIAHIGKTMRMNFTRLRPGERVCIQISTYDHNRGRVTKRLA